MARRQTFRTPTFCFLLFGALLSATLLSVRAFGEAASAEVDIVELAKPGIRVFTDKDGVPQNAVTVMRRDRNGYVWAGTRGGVAYYDGRAWVSVRMPEAARSIWIHSIAPASDGSIWFATLGGGVHRYQDGEWSSYTAASSELPHDDVYCVEEVVWQGTPTILVATEGGSARFENGKWVAVAPIPAEPTLPSHVVYGATDPDGSTSVWIGMDRAHVARFHDGGWTVYGPDQGIAGEGGITDLIQTTAIDGIPRVVASTQGGPLYFDGERWRELDKSNPKIGQDPRCMTETIGPDGVTALWIGGTAGLWRYTHGAWTFFDERDGLPFRIVWSLMETGRESGTSTLWVGTGGGGIAVWEQGRWVSLGVAEGLPDKSIYSLMETATPSGGRVYWVGTNQGGLVRFQDGKWTVFSDPNGRVPGDTVYSLLATEATDKTTSIWVGSMSSGIALYRNNRWMAIDEADGLGSGRVNSLLETTWPDGQAKVLAGTLTGITILDKEAPLPIDARRRLLTGNIIRSMIERRSSDGTPEIWVATNHGLFRMTTESTTVFNTNTGLPTDSLLNVRDVAMPDGRSAIWVGTEGGGVAWMDPSSDAPVWNVLSDRTVPALPNNVVYQVRQDRDGRVYLFTNRGVARLTPREPTAVDPSLFQIYTFTTADGLPSNECNTGASMVDSLGRIWAGTIAGVAVFDPGKEYRRTAPFPLRIERVTTENRARLLADGQVLDYWDNSLTFEFVLLTYFRENDTEYQTQLVGFDPNPSEWTSQYRRTYTNLPTGDYQFEVWGRDHQGVVAGPVQIGFSVRPAPWRTWWAYTMYALVAGALVVGGFRMRLRTLRRRNEELEQHIAQRTAELVHSEQRALQSERRAIDANRAKSVFLSNMSHELRTPLNAVIGFSQLMERSANLSSDQRENLAIIQRSSNHLLDLINDVLSISKIEAGQASVAPQPFDLRRLIAVVLDMIRVRAEAKGLSLESQIPDDLPSTVLGDESKLRQVLLNLLGNAVKFTAAGTVCLRARWADNRAVFAVEDTGHGIAPDEIPALFEAFVQTESGRRSGEGTGLGLMISRSFIRLMGGDISVQSELGKGSVFSFDVALPLTDHDSREEDRLRVVGIETGQENWRILVADDIAENRLLLVKLLRAVGFNVLEAADGAEALAIWTDWRPHAVWMDMRMPVMDGVEATQQIREREALERGIDGVAPGTVVIALTASAFEHERDAILAAGCDDFVTKPFREDVIFEKLSEHLDVRFLYADDFQETAAREAVEITTERFSNLPHPCIVELHDALQKGRMDEANAVAQRIGEMDNELGLDLIRAIRCYQIDELLSALETLQSEK